MLPELAKLAIAPAFVVIVTLVARRMGPQAAGFLAALPIVGGPILGVLVATHGSAFGATSALGTALGTAATMIFALVYARLAPRLGPAACLASAYAAYFAAAAASTRIPVSWPAAVVVPLASWLFVLRAFPDGALPGRPLPAPAWDLPVRALATLLLVATVTSVARLAGPELSGLITPMPIITAVLAVFSHAQGGAEVSALMLRALVRGLFTFLTFFWLVAGLLPRTSAPLAFAAAVASCLLLHAALGRVRVGVLR